MDEVVGLKVLVAVRPRGLMDKASDFGSEDCRFESCRGRMCIFISATKMASMSCASYVGGAVGDGRSDLVYTGANAGLASVGRNVIDVVAIGASIVHIMLPSAYAVMARGCAVLAVGM